MAKQTIPVPDIGGFTDVPVIDVYISPGDEVTEGDALMALESSKAVMDVPSPQTGVITEVLLKEGDTVSEGDGIAVIEVSDQSEEASQEQSEEKRDEPSASNGQPEEEGQPVEDQPVEDSSKDSKDPKEPKQSAMRQKEEPSANLQQPGGVYHATPATRQFARRVGVDISQVTGTGPKGRILTKDVEQYIHQVIESGGFPAGGKAPDIPREDYSAYGSVEEQELSRIKKISGPLLHASWSAIPHVTHFETADVTELEEFRSSLKEQGEGHSIISFVIPAVIQALREFPSFNASLDSSGKKIILKHYYHIGIAVDTPQGLVVPIIHDADKKTIRELTESLKDISSRAREGKLSGRDIQGGSFSISSLGGIGGTGFTPIINAPETAILGLSTMEKRPVWNEKQQTFLPRRILPFSISYDHRAIDGAEAARFARYLRSLLEDIRRILL